MVDSPLEQTVAQVYQGYQTELHTNNALDFDDLIRLTVALFRDNTSILKKYQQAWRYILVDEYQDTNHAQYSLVELLAQEHQNLCVVGDDFQCVTPNTKIKIPSGWKRAKDIQIGDKIIAGGGRNSTLTTTIKKKYSRTVTTDLFQITTKQGHTVKLTPRHIVFASLSNQSLYYYVYLMYRQTLGYRIGLVQGKRTSSGRTQHGLQVRGNQERADKMWIIRVCTNKQEAQYWEMYYAFYYGIPTTVFSPDNLTSIGRQEINQLFQNINTAERVEQLCQDLYLDLDFPHYRPSGTTRFKTERKVLRLDWFADTRRSTASPWCATRVALHTTNAQLKRTVVKHGYSARRSKKNTWRLELTRLKIAAAEQEAKKLQLLLPGVEMVRSAWLTDTKKMLLMPAAHLRVSMLLPILKNNKIIADEIVAVKKMPYHGPVIDIDVQTVHNYCANGVMIHNSIYSWRGANLQNILDFEDDYPKATVVVLEQNYRSTQSILAAANEVIKYNTKQKDKTLWTENGRGEKIIVQVVPDERAEGEYIIAEIFGLTTTERAAGDELNEIQYVRENEPTPAASMLDRIMHSRSFQQQQRAIHWQHSIQQRLRQLKLSDYVVLYRTNAQSRALEESFLKYHVPYRIIGGITFYQRREVKDVIAYLRVVVNPADWVSLERIIAVPARALGPNSWQKIEQACRQQHCTYLEITPEQLPSLRQQQREAFAQFQTIMQAITKQAAKLTPSETLELLLRKTGLRDQYTSKNRDDLARLENIEELKSVTKRFDHTVGSDGLHAFLEEVSLVSDQDQLDDTHNAVNLMTVHAAKGLEFPQVFITGLEEGLFPHARSLFNPIEMEEERRLCYVAITRAKHHLYLSYARQRTVYGKTQITAPSRFIADIPEQLLDHRDPDGV